MREAGETYCGQCGARISEGRLRCTACGAVQSPIPQPLALGAAGIPVVAYQPSAPGPPLPHDPWVDADPLQMHPSAVEREGYYRPIVPPPPRLTHSSSGCALAALLCTVVLLLGLAVVALARQPDVALRIGSFQIGSAQALRPSTTQRATATLSPECTVPLVDPTAAAALNQVRLATALRNPATRDYRPVGVTSVFRAGQRAYITFEVATAAAGKVGTLFCLGTGRVPGVLDVPANSSGHYGQFATDILRGDEGQGLVILTWNGAVAAVVPFSVVPGP